MPSGMDLEVGIASIAPCLMSTQDRMLLKKLAIVLALKLVVLMALWWGFVREQRVHVNVDRVAAQLLQTALPTAKESSQ